MNDKDFFNKYDDIAEYVLKKLDKISDYAEVFIQNYYGYSYAIEQGIINGGSFSDTSGLRIRVIKDGNLFTLTTDNIKKEKIDELISNIKKFRSKMINISEEKVEKANISAKIKTEVSEEKLLERLYSLDKLLKNSKGVKYRSVYGNFEFRKNSFINSEGSSIKSITPRTTLYLFFIVGNGSESRQRFLQLGGAGGFESIKNSEEKLENEINVLNNIIEKGSSLSLSEIKKIKNVVIAPEITGIAVHESVGHPNEADRVFGREAAQAGRSYITKEKFGMKIGSPIVNILDDPTIEGSYGFYLYDEEGVKARAKLLVKDGMQNELLLNREYAYELSLHSNASSRSDWYANEPIIRMSNTYLKKGDATLDELIAEAKNGIYIKSFTEWNIDDTRSFSLYQGNEAYLIKNGRIDKPIKNYKLESSTIDFWSAVKLLGKDFELYLGTCGKGEPEQGVPVTMGGPSALLKFG
ncbi:MAG: TldD/PmbA family protein [Candidatus Micrarchaeia archaeon]